MVVVQTAAGNGTVTAQVSGSENDPAASNNQGSATVTVTGSAYSLVPSVASISPSAIQTGAPDTTITVIGTNFVSGSTVNLDGTALNTSFASSTQLTATVPTAKLANMGWGAITVSNPAPGGGTSQKLPLTYFTVLTIGLNHILYEPFSGKLYASVGSGFRNGDGKLDRSHHSCCHHHRHTRLRWKPADQDGDLRRRQHHVRFARRRE